MIVKNANIAIYTMIKRKIMTVYMRQWNIESFTIPGKEYKVSQLKDGSYQCSCPNWIYRRRQCKHINAVMKMGITQHVPSMQTQKIRVQIQQEEFEIEELHFDSRWSL